MLEQLDALLELSGSLLTFLNGPIAAAILGLILYKSHNKKESVKKIQEHVGKILANVKRTERILGMDENNKKVEGLDPRMKKAVDEFDHLKDEEWFKKATKTVGLELEKLDMDDLIDALENLLHAKKLAMDFNVVDELKEKVEHKKAKLKK